MAEPEEGGTGDRSGGQFDGGAEDSLRCASRLTRWTAEEVIQRAFGEGEPAACPACGTLITGFALVGYDRQVICPNCGSNVSE